MMPSRSHRDRHPHNPAASNMPTPACISRVAQLVWSHVRIEPRIAHDFGERLVEGAHRRRFYSTRKSCQCGFQPRKRSFTSYRVRCRRVGVHPEGANTWRKNPPGVVDWSVAG
jgi:hypothetical protein